MKLWFLLVFTSSLAWSQASLSLKTKEGLFSLFEKEGLRVSENCLKASCQALVHKKEYQPKKDVLAGHPAAQYCEGEGGRYLIGTRESGDEDGLCVFKDKSYILGWDYFKGRKKE